MRRRPGEVPSPDEDDGDIREISLQDAASGMAGSRLDRAVVILAIVAVGGGLLLAAANAMGLGGPDQSAAGGSQVAAGSVSAQPSATPASPTPVPAAVFWNQTASIHAGDPGGVYRYECPAGGSIGIAYGVGVYALESSVCTAAVHWGLLNVGIGGSVSIQISPGVARFDSSSANGVLSQESGSADVSFVFVAQSAQEGPWSATAVVHRRDVGERFEYACPPDGEASPIWGTRIYTDDSSVCTAAVHAGLISFPEGGKVTVAMRPGRDFYRSSVQNQVVSGYWGNWDGSFVFVKR